MSFSFYWQIPCYHMFDKINWKMSNKKTSSKKQDNKEELTEEELVDQQEQSTENHSEASENTDNTAETNENTDSTSQEPTPEELIQAANDKYLRLYAEFENFRRRTAKEKLELISNASGDILKEVLPILDDMERAIESNKSSEDINTVKEGFELVYNKLANTLKSKGLKPMDSKETEFDTDKHEAITKIPAPTEELKGKVVDVVEKGYYLNDKVIRYAKVVIGE